VQELGITWCCARPRGRGGAALDAVGGASYGRRMSRSRRGPLIGTAVVLGLVLVVLLAPHHTELPIVWLSDSHLLGNAAAGGTPLWWALEDLGNVALFVPLGLVLALWFRPLPAWILATVGSICCETAQLWIPSRHASALDVAFNAVGAAIGIALVLAVRVVRNRARGGSDQATATSPHSVQAQ
jgi:VanZ like family